MRLFVLINFLFFSFPIVNFGKTIIVEPKGKISSLSIAQEKAVNGDTIIVRSGLYASVNTIIKKELTILGEGYPILNANFKDEVIIIKANNVKFDGFIVRNSKTGSLKDYAGIRVFQVKNVVISNNKLENNFFGIYLSDAVNIKVINNTSIGSNNKINSGNGIHLWKCKNILIKNNEVSAHRDGIYFEFVKQSHIYDNESRNNFRYGLHFMFSDDNIYKKNIFKNNGSGVAVMYSKRIKMHNNLFMENWGSSIYGLLLKDISNSEIKHNQFTRNTTGIYMEGCEGLKVLENNFNNNGWAVRVLANCENGLFMKNNFITNSFDVTTNGALRLHQFSNNYWDKYEGYDLDKNGQGDIPYRPISLYAQIIEQIPQAVMLMRSFIVNLLDKVERAIPSITPESVKDDNPSMKPWAR